MVFGRKLVVSFWFLPSFLGIEAEVLVEETKDVCKLKEDTFH